VEQDEHLETVAEDTKPPVPVVQYNPQIQVQPMRLDESLAAVPKAARCSQDISVVPAAPPEPVVAKIIDAIEPKALEPSKPYELKIALEPPRPTILPPEPPKPLMARSSSDTWSQPSSAGDDGRPRLSWGMGLRTSSQPGISDVCDESVSGIDGSAMESSSAAEMPAQAVLPVNSEASNDNSPARVEAITVPCPGIARPVIRTDGVNNATKEKEKKDASIKRADGVRFEQKRSSPERKPAKANSKDSGKLSDSDNRRVKVEIMGSSNIQIGCVDADSDLSKKGKALIIVS
jgi:hypothetical protein